MACCLLLLVWLLVLWNGLIDNMQFMLIVYACSVVYGACGERVQSPELYNTYKECMLAGYQTSIKAINILEESLVNQEKIFFKFNCLSTPST